MNKQNNGGQAFPGPCDATRGGDPVYPENGGGMGLRDYFAAKAMHALLRNNETDARAIARAAYIVADTLLKARQA